MEDSVAAIVRSGSIDMNEGAIGVAASSDIVMNDSTSLVLMAKRIEATDVRSLLLVAPKVKGSVETVFTPLTAFAAGAGLAFGVGLLITTIARIIARPFRRSRRG